MVRGLWKNVNKQHTPTYSEKKSYCIPIDASKNYIYSPTTFNNAVDIFNGDWIANWTSLPSKLQPPCHMTLISREYLWWNHLLQNVFLPLLLSNQATTASVHDSIKHGKPQVQNSSQEKWLPLPVGFAKNQQELV